MMGAQTVTEMRCTMGRGVMIAPAGFEADAPHMTAKALRAKYAINESSTLRLIRNLPHAIAEQRRANSGTRLKVAAQAYRGALTMDQKALLTKNARAAVKSKKRAGSSSPVNFGVPKPGMIAPPANSLAADLMQALRRHPMRFSSVHNAGREYGLNGPYVAGFNRLADLPALIAFCARYGIVA